MIATWMLVSTLFAALLGAAAVAAERALRMSGRQARGAWIAALAAAIVWPVVAPAAAIIFARPTSDGLQAGAPAAISTIGAIAATLPTVARSRAAYAPYIDVAVVALWAFTSVLLLVRLARAMRALSLVERSSTSEVIEGVPVLMTPSLGPAVFGVRRPRLVVPRWLLELDRPLRALVLRHEQEHCRARDPQLTLAAAVAAAVVPWNAAVWWIARRLRLAVELDCDARVLRGAAQRERYGRLLLYMAQRQSLTRLVPMLAESNSHLSRRITTMNATAPTNLRARLALLAVIAVVAIACATKYATDLTAAPSMPALAFASLSQGADTSCLAVEVRAGEVLLGRPATVAPNSGTPRFPDILRSAGLDGYVLSSFVVRPSGKADAGSFKVLHSTHELFSMAVQNALPNMNFEPPLVGAQEVSQLVQQPFFFHVQGSEPTGSWAPPAASASGSCTAPGRKGVWTLPAIVVTAP
jgi:beta-lactamase regulating signal transducer with metallopeptidase domain